MGSLCALLVTPSSVSELEQLYLGLYGIGISDGLILAKDGSPLLTRKWHHTLRELDFSGQGFSEKDLEQALAVFSGTPGGLHPALCSLNLRGTRVTPSTVRSVHHSLVLWILNCLLPCLTWGPEVCSLTPHCQGPERV